jgi:hypothetical protein
MGRIDLMADADYIERVGFQLWLDETFPKGAAFVLINRVEGRWLPGEAMLTGRMFCAGARLGEDREWQFKLFAEPFLDEGAFGFQPEGDPGWIQPMENWVPGLFSVERVPGLFEGAVVLDDGTVSEDVKLRVSSVLEGPRVIPQRIRDEQTSRWEQSLFPDGLEVT